MNQIKQYLLKTSVEFNKQTELESIWIGDSALCSQENLQLMKEMRWITRVSLTIKKARELIQKVDIEEKEKRFFNLKEITLKKLKE